LHQLTTTIFSHLSNIRDYRTYWNYYELNIVSLAGHL